MTTIRIALAGIGLLALAGCGSSPKTLSANSEGVSIRFDGSESQLTKASGIASNECARAGRVSVLRDVSRIQDGSLANFECRRGS